jgi:glycogen(starch) synthase
MTKTVSVIINTYNREQELCKAIESFSWQRHQNFELIVVNGPSTDGTRAMLERFSSKIRIAHCKEANLSMSRNIGLSLAMGEIIAYIDDDGIPEPDWLEELCKPYEDPAVGGVGGYLRDHTGFAYQSKVVACDRYADAHLFGSIEVAHKAGVSDRGPGSKLYFSPTGCNSSFRRSALKQIGGFDEEYAYFLDETDVAIRLIDNGWAVVYAPTAEVHHKYAESHLRTANKIPRSIYLPARSKAYFAIRHAAPQSGLSAAFQYLVNYRIERRRDKTWLKDNNLIDNQLHERLLDEIHRGTCDGVADAFLYPAGRTRKFEALEHDLHTFEPLLPSSERLRLCFISQDYPPGLNGGIAVWTHTLAVALAARGHEVSVVSRGNRHTQVDFIDGVWVHRVPASHHLGRKKPELPDLPTSISDWAYTVYDEVQRIHARRGIDLVSAPIWDVEGIACLAGGMVPVITSLHSTYRMVLQTKRKWLEDKTYRSQHVDKVINAEEWLISNSDLVLANSNAIVRDIESAYNLTIDSKRLGLVHHGMPLEEATNPATRGKGCRILYVGRFESRKGIDILMESISPVLESEENARFVLVGDTNVDEDGRGHVYRNQVERLLERYPGRITMTGYLTRSELIDEYRSADIFVAPSRYESFGIIFLEAMAQGVACVGTEVGGIPEVVLHNKTGLLVPPEDAEALANALIRLSRDEDLRLKCGEAGLNRFLSTFTASKMAEEIEVEYGRVIKNSKLQIRD